MAIIETFRQRTDDFRAGYGSELRRVVIVGYRDTATHERWEETELEPYAAMDTGVRDRDQYGLPWPVGAVGGPQR